MNLIFATNNLNKLNEVRSLVRDRIHIFGLAEVGFSIEIPEDYPNLEQNASQKAWFIYHRTRKNCFADDTGLEVDALSGEPGVFSARYSRIGDIRYPEMEANEGNIRKLLEKMGNNSNRRARFRTVFSLILNNTEYQFEGIIEGSIAYEKLGENGFGYDPVFIPLQESLSFAQMDLERKNEISHRAIATKKLISFLNNLP